MLFRSKLLILLLPLMLTSCAMFDHRDYEMVMNEGFDEEMWVPEKDFDVVPGDSGRSFRNDEELYTRVPMSVRDQKDLQYYKSLEEELIHKENRLNEAEYEDYNKIKHKLGSTSQKIYFLGLSHSEKLEYIQARNINFQRSYTPQDLYRNDINKPKPIGLGMSKSDVVNQWGRPINRQFAGSPSDQNEKWSYRQGSVTKHIYFEHGHVEGWTEQ